MIQLVSVLFTYFVIMWQEKKKKINYTHTIKTERIIKLLK